MLCRGSTVADAEMIGEHDKARVHAELPAHPALSGRTQLSAQRGVTTERGDHVRQCLRVLGWHEASGFAVDDQFWDGRRIARDARETLALGFHQDVRQTVTIAALGDTARENEKVRLAIEFQHRFLGERAAKIDVIADVKIFGHTVQTGCQCATTNMDKPPVHGAGHACQGAE